AGIGAGAAFDAGAEVIRGDEEVSRRDGNDDQADENASRPAQNPERASHRVPAALLQGSNDLVAPAVPRAAVSGFLDRAAGVDPCLEAAQIAHIAVAHVLQGLAHQGRAAARGAVGDYRLAAVERSVM